MRAVSRNIAIAVVAAASMAAVPVVACTPTVQWIWDGPTQGGGYPQTCATPLVLQLTDDDRNGRIDAADVPDVAFTHQSSSRYEAVLTALDGATGSEHWTATRPLLMPTALVGGDIDGDGLVELVAVRSDGRALVAFEHDGTLKWTSAASPVALYEFSALGIADLDQDGAPELFSGATVWGADGSFKWNGTAGRGAEGYWNAITISNAADIDPASPGLELVAGNSLYAADGSLLWQHPTLPDGFTAVADLDRDGQPEIVLATNSELYVLDRQGNARGAPWPVAGRVLSQPVVADFNGDGAPEIAAINDYIVDVVSWSPTGWTRTWTAATNDDTRLNGGSAFDLDGDGAAELLYHDSWRWYIFDGRSGTALSTLDFVSATTIEVPVPADLDHDCAPEILVTGCQGGISPPSPNQVIAYECAGSRPARAMWNELGYHVTNVEDDGRIPRIEPAHWTARNSWQEQTGGGGPAAIPGPDLEICPGVTVTLDGSASSGCAGAAEYRWREGLAVRCDWSAAPDCTVTPASSPASYTLDLRCTGQPGCEASGTVVVTQAAAVTAAAGPDASVCEGRALTLDGSGSSAPGCAAGLIYEWREGATVMRPAGPSPTWSPATTPLGTRTYTIAAWCAAGPRCEATDTVAVEVRDCPLSVSWASWSAERTGTEPGSPVEVRWRTLAEHGTLCFTVERSSAGSGTWASVGDCLEARGALSDYRQLDPRPVSPGVPSPLYRVVEWTTAGAGDTTPAFAITGPEPAPAARGRRLRASDRPRR